jgi:hypothetical protein
VEDVEDVGVAGVVPDVVPVVEVEAAPDDDSDEVDDDGAELSDGLLAFAAAVGLVEAAALEGDPDRGEHLLDRARLAGRRGARPRSGRRR